jgi:hypothetical protein
MTSFHDPAKSLARPTLDFSRTRDGMADYRNPLPALPVLTIAAARSPAMVRRSPNVSGANG